MPQFTLDSQKSSERSREGHRWASSRVRANDRVVKIPQHPRPALRVLIVDRDSMSSDLLASVLSRDCRCQAAAVPPSDLLNTLASNEADLVVVGVDLNSKSGGGFDLASAVCRSYPNIYVVMLMNQMTNELVINAFRCGA